MSIAQLVAGTFDVRKNSSVDFHYVVQSSPIPLDEEQMKVVDMALKEDQIRFNLKGNFRARWRVGLLGSVKFWRGLNCDLRFRPSSHEYINASPCSSKAK